MLETALIIGGTLTSALGAIKQGQAASASAKFNAKKAQFQGQGELDTANENARRRARIGKKNLGTLRLLNVSGDVMEDQAIEEALEVASIKHGGRIRAQGHQNTAQLNLLQADAALEGAAFDAGGVLLKGGAAARRSHKAGD